MPDLHIHAGGDRTRETMWRDTGRKEIDRKKEEQWYERAGARGSKRRNWIPNPLSEAKPDVEDYGKYRGLILATVSFVRALIY